MWFVAWKVFLMLSSLELMTQNQERLTQSFILCGLPMLPWVPTPSWSLVTGMPATLLRGLSAAPVSFLCRRSFSLLTVHSFLGHFLMEFWAVVLSKALMTLMRGFVCTRLPDRCEISSSPNWCCTLTAELVKTFCLQLLILNRLNVLIGYPSAQTGRCLRISHDFMK